MKYTNEIEMAKFLEQNFQLQFHEFSKKNLAHMYDGLTYCLKSGEVIGKTWVTPCTGKFAKLKLVNIAQTIGIDFDWKKDSFIF